MEVAWALIVKSRKLSHPGKIGLIDVVHNVQPTVPEGQRVGAAPTVSVVSQAASSSIESFTSSPGKPNCWQISLSYKWSQFVTDKKMRQSLSVVE